MEFKGLHVHFVGIGGVSMEALSRLIAIQGAVISGSDQGIPPGHVAENIHDGLDMVVVNGAISNDNVEVARAQELGIRIIDRAELLAEIEGQYKNRISIAGTHGKSTTTAMIGAILVAGGLNPTVHNGARPNLILGGRDYFVTEACEFKRSFLKLNPTVAVITNIDADHLDCYRDLDEIKATFAQFTAKAQTVFHTEYDIEYQEYERGKYSFVVAHGGRCVIIKLGIVGRHNVFNAMLAVRVGLHFGVDLDSIKAALEAFKGVDRRFQNIGKLGQATVIADYAHHPNEIKTTINTGKALFGDRFLVVFQPHTYSRTIALFDDFVRVLGGAQCVLYKTFSAREKPMKGGAAFDLAKSLHVKYLASKQSIYQYLKKVAPKYDAIILTGAGDVNTVTSF